MSTCSLMAYIANGFAVCVRVCERILLFMWRAHIYSESHLCDTFKIGENEVNISATAIAEPR